MNDIQLQQEQLREMFAAQILQAKTHFIHVCLSVILPKEIYDKASKDNDMALCERWAKAQGYYWSEGPGETRLFKGQILVGMFKPVLKDGKDAEGNPTRHCVFVANVLGQPVNLAVTNPLLN